MTLSFLLGWTLVLAAITLIGITKSGFGSGAGLLIPPITILGCSFIPSWHERGHDVLPLLLPLLILGDVIAVWQNRRHFSGRTVLRLLPGSIVGIAIGSALLFVFLKQKEQVTAALVNVDVGFESAFLVSLHWYRLWRTRHQRADSPPYRPGMGKSLAVGAFAGVSSTLAHAAGPIIALHVLPQKLERRTYVGTCAVYFMIVNSLKLPGYYKAHMFSQGILRESLNFAPLVLVGAVIGLAINKRISDAAFSAVVYVTAFVAGWYLLIVGTYGLWTAW